MSIKIEKKIVSVSLASTTQEDDHHPTETIIIERKLLERGSAPLDGSTYKIKPGDNPALYVTLNYSVDEDSGDLLPFEIFIHTQDARARSWTDFLTRVISSNFRNGGDFGHLVDDAKSSIDAEGYWSEGRYYDGIVSHLGFVIEEWLEGLNSYNRGESEEVDEEAEAIIDEMVSISNCPTMPKCPKCSDYALIMSNGCETCTSCSYSKCG